MSYQSCLKADTDELEILIEGTLQSDTQIYEVELDNERFDGSEVNLHLDFEARYSDVLFVSKSKSRRYLTGDQQAENRLQEAWLKYESDNYDIKIGKQIFQWGKGTFINPTSIATPKDYRDIIDTTNEEFGLLSLSFKYYIQSETYQFIYIPEFKASRLPSIGTRWFFDLPDSIKTPGSNVNLPSSYRTHYDDSFESKTDNNQFLFRYSNYSNQFDYSLIYHKGIDSLPVFTEEILSISPEQAEIQINGSFTKFEMLGGDLALPVGKWMARVEAAYFYTEDSSGLREDKDDPYFHLVIGFDRSFNNLLFDKDLFFAVEWSQQEAKTDIDYESNDLRHLFDKTLFLKADIELSSDSELLFESLYDFSDEDYLIKLSHEYKMTEEIKLATNIFIMGGPQHSFFGQYQNNNRLQFKLEAYF